MAHFLLDTHYNYYAWEKVSQINIKFKMAHFLPNIRYNYHAWEKVSQINIKFKMAHFLPDTRYTVSHGLRPGLIVGKLESQIREKISSLFIS